MFINHSTEPNYDVVSDIALRDIIKGEELFEDYRMMDNWEKVRPSEKNIWLTAISAIKPKSPRSLIVARLAQRITKNFVRNWTRGLATW